MGKYKYEILSTTIDSCLTNDLWNYFLGLSLPLVGSPSEERCSPTKASRNPRTGRNDKRTIFMYLSLNPKEVGIV